MIYEALKFSDNAYGVRVTKGSETADSYAFCETESNALMWAAKLEAADVCPSTLLEVLDENL